MFRLPKVARDPERTSAGAPVNFVRWARIVRTPRRHLPPGLPGDRAGLNFIVAEQYNQEPAKVASIVLLGNLAALVFVPLGSSIALC